MSGWEADTELGKMTSESLGAAAFALASSQSEVRSTNYLELIWHQMEVFVSLKKHEGLATTVQLRRFG